MKFFRSSLLSIILVCLVSTLSAQTDLKMRPLGLLLGNYNLSVDQAISPKFSFETSLLLYQNAFRFNLGDFDPIDSGFGILGIGKMYVSQSDYPTAGLYTGPYLSYKNLFSSGGGNSQRGSLGWVLGYKALLGSGFLFETDLGVGRAAFTQSSSNYDPWGGSDALVTNLDAFFRITIGYRIVQ